MRAILFWLSTIAGAVLFVYITAYRFTHAGMTETQLFLRLWPHSIGAIAFLGIAYFLLAIYRRNP